jgi:hypothetical protein
MLYAVYYKNRKLSPATNDRTIAEKDLKRLSGIFINIEIKQVMG